MPLNATSAEEPKVFVIHENDKWVEPLPAAFAAKGILFEEWHLRDGLVDLTQPPSVGVFYNRTSSSSHTRGHRFAPEFAGATLAWLTAHGRTVLNGERPYRLKSQKSRSIKPCVHSIFVLLRQSLQLARISFEKLLAGSGSL